MMKKLIALVCGLLPMVAGAVTVYPTGDSVFVSTQGADWQAAISNNETIVIDTSIAHPNVSAIKSPNGFSILNNVYLGRADQGSGTGDLYILSSVANPFTIETQGDISIGAILQVLGGKTLAFKNDTNDYAFDVTIGGNAENEGIKVGEAGQTAALLMEDVGDLTVNAGVNVYGDFSVSAQSVDISGGISIDSGEVSIETTGNVSFAGLTVSGTSTTNIVAGGQVISNGVIQNNAGDMNITADYSVPGSTQGALVAVGGVQNNSAADMVIDLNGAMYAGQLVNSSQGGTLRINASMLDASVAGAMYSLVNNGNFYADITGQTRLMGGVDLSGMNVDNEFYLKTESLYLGGDVSQLFLNYLNDYQLIVTDGGINAGVLQNGVNDAGTINDMAQMTLNINGGVVADSIMNSGRLLSVVSQGEIYVAGTISSSKGQMELISGGVLSADGGVTNQGNMTLNANFVSLQDVTNSGSDAVLNISSLSDETGFVQVNGSLVNDGGDINLSAKDISVYGEIESNKGTIDITGSDTNGGAVQIGAIDVAGGVINLNALAGSVDVINAGGVAVSDGTLNLGAAVKNLNVNNGSVQVDGDIIASATATDVSGDMNITAGGNAFVLSANSVSVGGDINVTASDMVRNIQFDTILTQVSGDVNVSNKGMLTLGKTATSGVEILGALSVDNGGFFESYSNEIVAASVSSDSLLWLHGEKLTASDGNIDIDGNLYFDPSKDPVSITTGMVVRDTNNFSMNATDINVGAVSVGSVNTLNMNATDTVAINGAVVNNGVVDVVAQGAVSVLGAVTNKDNMRISGAVLGFADVANVSEFSVMSSGNVSFGNISHGGDLFSVNAMTAVAAESVSQTSGVMDVVADRLMVQDLTISGATSQANLNAANIIVSEDVNISGDMVQGGDSGMLNHYADSFAAYNLYVDGDVLFDSLDTTYNIGSVANVGGELNATNGASVFMNAGSSITATGVKNDGDLTLSASYALNLGNLVNNSGVLNLVSRTVSLDTFAISAGNVLLSGEELNLSTALNTTGVLYQGYRGALADADINVKSVNYVINTSNLKVNGIEQTGNLLVNSSDIDVGGNINATDLRFVAVPVDNWMNVDIAGNISGGVDFIGLEKMTVGGDYVFDSSSNINAVILPYAAGSTIDSTDVNYWSNVGINSDNLLVFENSQDGGAMINIGGKFTAGNAFSLTEPVESALEGGQIGISLRDVVDQGTAIWFVHADGGVVDAGDLDKVRNLSVRYCNADGSICYDYLESLDVNNGTEEDLPAYIAARDNDLYIVFDPRFGGPIEVFKIQPIVASGNENTYGEIVSAGALDNMIAGRLRDKKFLNRTPIEVIPLAFQGTNMQEMAMELYNRMEYYAENDRNSDSLAHFSRLFQPREIEQIMGTMVLNEHTAYRSFEDRMFDEFIWNRNRNLKKAWLDVDYGVLYQDIQDGKHTDGNRFSIFGGFDWQETDTLQLGLMGRISHTTSKATDRINLGYMPGQEIVGRVATDVADTNIALGAYLMETVNEKVRIYGNAMADMHIFDLSRTQNYVDAIDGDGAAFALSTEWGIMHDILNQYIVGNLYARAGYNFGFEVKEGYADRA